MFFPEKELQNSDYWSLLEQMILGLGYCSGSSGLYKDIEEDTASVNCEWTGSVMMLTQGLELDEGF